jgi:hypothetical protein
MGMSKSLIVPFLLLAPLSLQAQPPMGGPPPEAFSACSGKTSGAECRFAAPHGEVSGTCRQMRQPELICVPAGGPPPRMGGGPPPVGGQGSVPRGAEIARSYSGARPVASRIPDTGQGSCFDNSAIIPCPQPGQPFYGQDAQYIGAQPSYLDNGDGTVTDLVTSLMWQKAHNEKRLGWYAAKAQCESLDLGGHTDWRLPGIKELYSIANFSGATGTRPFLAPVLEIHPPDASILQGDRFAATHHTDMMGQTWSATLYTGDHWDRPGVEAAFFFNFLDGRIKQAPTHVERGLFYRCVRGPQWGENDFKDNGDGTTTDRASGLMWQQTDDGVARDWRDALAYCEGLALAGHTDWRLPNAKELLSIVDYSRNDPALDGRFLHQQDNNGWFWSSTTHGEDPRNAVYVCFGKCVSADGVDVHGAGAQRSDPKTGDPSLYSAGRGGQRDQVRIFNYSRCVRSAP